MTDTTTKTAAGHITKSKVSFTDFKPRTFSPELYKNGPYKVGLLVGSASKKIERSIVDQKTGLVEKYEGLGGAFKLIPGHDAHPKSEHSIGSGICYLPEAWSGSAFDALEGLEVGGRVNFVFEVSLGQRGADGYEWIVRDLRPPTATNPLDALMNDPALQIGAPTDKPKG